MIQDSGIKFVFFGTPELSVEILECLKRHGFTPSFVVTNPDRPQGRKMLLTPPPVKVWATENHIPYLQPEKLDESFVRKLQAEKPEVCIVVAYGKIIPKSVLDVPSKGTLNIHYSLLPKYRGASPIESAILNDDRHTGVSILLLDEKMDHGPLAAERALEFADWPIRASELRTAMNNLAGTLLVETLPPFLAGSVKLKSQDHSKATYTGKFVKNDGLLDLTADPYKNFLKVMAFDDSIGTYFFTEKAGKKVRVIVKDAAFKNGQLEIVRVVPEGKKEMPYGVFLQN